MLGIKIERDPQTGDISISQRQYAKDMLEEFGMSDCHPGATPMLPGLTLTKELGTTTEEESKEYHSIYMSAVGCLMYLATQTRPDIAYPVGALACFNFNPGEAHWKAVKHLFRYIKGTLDYHITYSKLSSPSPSTHPFTTYSDADHGGCRDTGKSTGGYLVMINGGPVSWKSKLQCTVSLSTTEAEYIAGVEAGKELKWIRNLLWEMGHKVTGPSQLLMDNQSAIRVSKNPEHHGRMKHLDLAHYWLHDEVARGSIDVHYVPTKEQLGDILTKPLPLVQQLNICLE
ncbi:Integrase catalytic domain-containing protein [Mycena sanguinolenta]|uniref:Integrase catalytic domain-containing protein n=1 Tax=Mycena sanguinolenta TaxID=230812 RepID=A0A8H7DF61_9AGAR|nr:Integrase catalytic domain-containing protein [Mycena sanguinolenta]